MSIVRVPIMARTLHGVLHVLLVASLLLMPVTALAAPVTQEGTLDPAVLAALERSSAIVAAAAGKGSGVVSAPIEEPPVEEPVTINPSDLVIGPETEVEFGGVSLLVPDTWTVEEDEWSGLPVISEEGTGFEIEVMDAEGAFPGLLLFPILEGNADLFIQSFGGGELVGISRITTEDSLPGVRIAYTVAEDPDGSPIAGALYFVATGASAYGIMSKAGADFWPIYEPAVDAMVESMILDEDRITLVQAGAEGIEATDVNEQFALTVPADWYYSPVDDESLGLSIADPDLAVVGAMMAQGMEDASDEELDLLGRIISGEEDPEQLQEFLDVVLSGLDMGEGESLDVDEARTATFPGDGQVSGTIRIVGDMVLEDGPTLPLTLYMSILQSDAAIFIFFGDPDLVEAAEPVIFTMIGSMEVLE